MVAAIHFRRLLPPSPSRAGLRAPSRGHKAAHGFTLTELLAVIAVVGILTALAVPNLRDLIVSQGIKNASFDVYSSLVFARNTAITRSATVTITPTAGANWAKGWTITAADGTVVRKQDAYPTNILMTGPASLAFNGMGRVNGVAGTINLTASNTAALNSRCISIDLSGRPVTKKGVC